MKEMGDHALLYPDDALFITELMFFIGASPFRETISFKYSCITWNGMVPMPTKGSMGAPRYFERSRRKKENWAALLALSCIVIGN